MRYRPFGPAGAAVSNLTFSLGLEAVSQGPEHASGLIFTALEAGINSYRLETSDPVLTEIVGRALSHVDRKLLNVSLSLGQGAGRKGAPRDFSAYGMTHAIDHVLHVSGLGWLDLALLHEPGEHELPQASLNALKALRATGRIRQLGVSGDGEVMDAYVSTGAFDVLATPYHVNAAWQVRSRVRAAREQDMAVFVYDYFPEALDSARKASSLHAPRKSLFGLPFGRPKASPLADVGTFAFLYQTPHWDAESICLAHVMTDPSVSSVLVQAASPERLIALASVPERDLPPGLAAQIEMARVRTAKAA